MAKPYSFSFSYSRWSLWKKCPLAYKYQNVDKIDTGPPSPALQEGRKVHDDARDYLIGKMPDMPKRMAKHYSKLAGEIAWMRREMKKGIVRVEDQLAYDRDWRPVSWFSPNTYARFIWDACLVDDADKDKVTEAHAVDWKTGKPYGSYEDQMQIFSIPAFLEYPNLQVFKGYLLYLDTGEDQDFTITQDQFMTQVWPTWTSNIAMMEADVSYPAKPSHDACKFCDFGKRKLNICAHGV